MTTGPGTLPRPRRRQRRLYRVIRAPHAGDARMSRMFMAFPITRRDGEARDPLPALWTCHVTPRRTAPATCSGKRMSKPAQPATPSLRPPRVLVTCVKTGDSSHGHTAGEPRRPPIVAHGKPGVWLPQRDTSSCCATRPTDTAPRRPGWCRRRICFSRHMTAQYPRISQCSSSCTCWPIPMICAGT